MCSAVKLKSFRMNDPRYDREFPAYRQDVFQKLDLTLLTNV